MQIDEGVSGHEFEVSIAPYLYYSRHGVSALKHRISTSVTKNSQTETRSNDIIEKLNYSGPIYCRV